MIGVGLIGCGHIAQTRHLPALRRASGVRVVALADVETSRCRRVASGHGIPCSYSTAAELLADPAVDAVGVLVPAARHADVVLEAIAAGKHVLVEKPLALDLHDCERMVAAGRGSGLRLGVAFNLRAHRLVGDAARILGAGTIGEVKTVRTVLSGPAPDDTGWRGWRNDPALGGGVLVEKAPHHYDLWRWLGGAEVTEVSAVLDGAGTGRETAALSARLDSGAVVSSLFAHSSVAANEVVVQGTEGELCLSLLEYDGLRLTPVSSQPGDVRLRARRIRAAIAQLPAGVASFREGGDYVASFRREWERFAGAVEGANAVDATLEDGYHAVAIALAAIESARRGECVAVGSSPRELASAAGVREADAIGRGS